MPEKEYIAKFAVYQYSVSTPNGRVTAYTFAMGAGRERIGTVVAPGAASINPIPPERLMVPLGITGYRYSALSASEAIDAAKRGDFRLEWEEYKLLPLEAVIDGSRTGS